MSNPLPYIRINLREIHDRNDAARHIIAGFTTAAPTLASIWQYLDQAIDDLAGLAAEVTRLSGELQNARLDCANLLAAARATIAAHHDGEPDPLFYLRDEIAALIPLSPATGERQ